jgi:hypothetical protein
MKPTTKRRVRCVSVLPEPTCDCRFGRKCRECAPEGHLHNPFTGVFPATIREAWGNAMEPAEPTNHLELRWREEDGEDW